ncbi:MAG: hypothetical protein K2X53_05790, partial [Alphaproteobacteria bacterium]|nr:hypothetical protein [Alphaproteobacteria bacterium]
VGSFIVGHQDQILLITDSGKILRCPVEGIRIAGRNTQGVTLFNVEDSEKVVSVARVTDDSSGDDEEGADIEGTDVEGAEVLEGEAEVTVDAVAEDEISVSKPE